MGCTLCKQLAGHNVGALDVSNYENLNPYLMKKSARQFRTHMSKKLEQLGPQTQPEVSCEIIFEGEDPTVQNISEDELRRCARVLRSFSTSVQNEIVGACLLSRPNDVNFYKYDYSTSMIIGLRRRASQELASAALVVFHGQTEGARCLEVIWVATMRNYRERGYACLLFGFIQQLAVFCQINSVLVLSSRTTVGFWLCQPHPPGAPKRVLVRGRSSSKRLTKGMKATPKKLAKLKRGLLETEQYEEPPDWLAPYYDDARPFRFSHTKSIHLWYPLGGPGVDYLGTAMQVANGKRRRASSSDLISPEKMKNGGGSGKKSPGEKIKISGSRKSGKLYAIDNKNNSNTSPNRRHSSPGKLNHKAFKGHTMSQISNAKIAAKKLKHRQKQRRAKKAMVKRSISTPG